MKTTVLGVKNWTSETCTLLNTINRDINEQDNFMLFLRHSHRESHSGYGDVNTIQLSEEGKIAAFEFGSSLPIKKNYRIYHSKIKRTEETAVEIQRGLQNAHVNNHHRNRVEIMGILPPLTGMAGIGLSIFSMVSRDKESSIFKWAAGHYPRTDIEPFTSYIQRAAKIMWGQHLQAEPGTIDILISHDFHLMALQNGWSGLLKEGEWIKYLGGFIVKLNPESLIMYKNGRKINMSYPFWFQYTNHPNHNTKSTKKLKNQEGF